LRYFALDFLVYASHHAHPDEPADSLRRRYLQLRREIADGYRLAYLHAPDLGGLLAPSPNPPDYNVIGAVNIPGPHTALYETRIAEGS
jgi:hypothetical protein